MRSLRPMTLLLALAALAPLGAEAQDLHPSRRPSPMGMARITLGDDAYVRVVYGRPYQRDRDNIFGTKESGALVPYGEIWRTGANEATELTVTEPVTIGGTRLEAGTYSLFTTPGPETWQIHVNPNLGMNGTGYFEDGKFTPVDVAGTNLLTVPAPATTLPEDQAVDQLTISFERTGEASADMILRWIRTEVRVPVAVAAE